MSDKGNSNLDERIAAARREADRQVAAERRDIIEQATERGIMEEVAEERTDSQQLAEEVAEAVARDDPAKEKARARRETLSMILLLILLFLILYLIAAATGQTNIIQFPGGAQAAPAGPADGDLAGQQGLLLNSLSNLRDTYPGAVGAPGNFPIPTYEINPLFRDYYFENGGLPVFGYPVSNLMNVNGRDVQWFERARLEHWPEPDYAGTPYEIQGGRIGVEYTGGRAFPQQAPFISTPTNRYFPETSYGVRGPILQFWQQNGDLRIFGYPISNEVEEELSDGSVHVVQYFERARIEVHPEAANPAYDRQLGLIGTALHMQTDDPDVLVAPQPTLVPLPTPMPVQP